MSCALFNMAAYAGMTGGIIFGTILSTIFGESKPAMTNAMFFLLAIMLMASVASCSFGREAYRQECEVEEASR